MAPATPTALAWLHPVPYTLPGTWQPWPVQTEPATSFVYVKLPPFLSMPTFRLWGPLDLGPAGLCINPPVTCAGMEQDSQTGEVQTGLPYDSDEQNMFSL